MTIQIGYVNLVDAAATTISSNSEETSLPDDNVAHFWKTKVWRATGDAAEWIKFDLGSAIAIDGVCIVGHNFTSGATVTLEGNATDAWGAPTVSQVLTYNANIMLHIFTAAQTYQWWRITIADGANPDTYIEAGRIFLGDFWSPTRNFVEFAHRPIDLSVISYSDHGVKSVDEKNQLIEMAFGFRNLTIDDFETMRAITGSHDDFFIVPDYANALRTDGKHGYSRYGSFVENPEHFYVFSKKYDLELVFRESL